MCYIQLKLSSERLVFDVNLCFVMCVKVYVYIYNVYIIENVFCACINVCVCHCLRSELDAFVSGTILMG